MITSGSGGGRREKDLRTQAPRPTAYLALAYYAVPGDTDAVAVFRTQATRHWYKALRRRPQRSRTDWGPMNRIATRWLPPARVRHPFPNMRFDARTQGRSPVR